MAKKYLQLGSIIKKLLFDKNMRAADLAREINIPSPTIHRLITGKSTRPYRSSLKPIADYFSVSIDELIGEKPFQLDQPITDKTNRTFSAAKTLNLPLIPWKNLNPNLLIDKIKYDIVPFAGYISDKGYATILEDSSMEPLFSCGSMLIFDPNKPFKDRSFVLVQLYGNATLVFRQLLIDLNQKYLKPLNPDLNAFKMRPVEEKDLIIATLVEARQVY